MYWPTIERIIRANVGQIVSIRATGTYEDQHLARDYVVDRLVIACRVRRLQASRREYRDMTIREWRKSGAETEKSKILAGKVRWYLYAWADDKDIREWMIVDCAKFLQFKGRQLPVGAWERKPNRDGQSGFLALHPWWLQQIGAIVAYQLGDRWLVKGRAA